MTIIEATSTLVNQIMEEDRMITTTIRFREGYLTASDRHFARFLKFVREYPRADPARPYL
jgi:hypothetical protein